MAMGTLASGEHDFWIAYVNTRKTLWSYNFEVWNSYKTSRNPDMQTFVQIDISLTIHIARQRGLGTRSTQQQILVCKISVL